jgi:hypothetical protein
MTSLLKQALAKVRGLPEIRQDELALMLLSAVDSDSSGFRLTAEQAAEVEKRLQEEDEVVSIDSVKAKAAAWAK